MVKQEGALGRSLEALGLEVPRGVATAAADLRWKPLLRHGESEVKAGVKAKPQERTDGHEAKVHE